MRRASASLLCACTLLLAPAAVAQGPAGRGAGASASMRPVSVTTVASRPAARPAPRAAADTTAPAVGGFAMQGVALTPGQRVLVRSIDARYAEERRTITGGDPRRATEPAVRAALFRSIDRMLAEERELLTAGQQRRFDQNVDAVHASWARLRSR